MNVNIVYAILFLLAGLFGMGSWIYQPIDSRVGFALIFVVGVIMLLTSKGV